MFKPLYYIYLNFANSKYKGSLLPMALDLGIPVLAYLLDMGPAGHISELPAL